MPRNIKTIAVDWMLLPDAIKLCSLRERTVQTDLEVLTDSFCSCGSSSSLSDSYRSHDDG